ncbi:MAG: T9SS type A sorting domain-containing protein [Fibrobacteres bacterium]|nr:T9SS type A sorting domain-containing protein [Fibrobacterota bacterium]
MIRSFFPVSLIFVLITSLPLFSSVISDAAARMKVNGWLPIITTGDARFTTSNGTGNMPIFVWANKACWDSITDQILFMGCPHAMPTNFVAYDAKTNVWRDETLPAPEYSVGGHAYDANAIDNEGNYYHLTTGSGNPLWRYNTKTDNWTMITQNGTKPTSSYGASLNYFPEMKSLVHIYGGKVSRFNLTTNTWSSIGTASMGDYHNLSAYNPVGKFMLLGGGNGSGQMHKLDSNGTLTAIKPASFAMAVGGLTCDPVTGTFLFKGDSLYALNMSTQNWSAVNKFPLTSTSSAYVACPISELGVIAFVGYGTYSCLLYKYAEGVSIEREVKQSVDGNRVMFSSFPNPINSTTKISFSVEKNSSVYFAVYSANGQMIKEIYNGRLGAGHHSYNWNATDGNEKRIVPGVYYYKLTIDGVKFTHKTVLIK